MSVRVLEALSRQLDEAQPKIAALDEYYAGEQALSFLSPAAAEALGNRLRALAVNYPRLATDALAERLRVVGFSTDGEINDDIWRAWEDSGFEDRHHVAHVEALVTGRSYVTVWADRSGGTTLSVESARETAVQRDPVTREVTAAAKRWREDGRARAVLLTPDRITEYTSEARVPEGGVIPPTGWNAGRSRPNPLGVVPVVPLVNRGRLLDTEGTSEMLPIIDLSDALNKILADMLVTSEFYARPRRWVTGLEIQEDEEGNPVNPFNESPQRVWQSESPETRFGEFSGSSLGGYESAVATLTQQIGALSGLPPHYLGLHGDQPASADAIRSAEASLVAKAMSRQHTFGPSWGQVARLISAVTNGRTPRRVEVVWQNPETRTPAQAADAAVKLHAEGIVPTDQVLLDLGYSPEQITAMRTMRAREAIERAPLPEINP